MAGRRRHRRIGDRFRHRQAARRQVLHQAQVIRELLGAETHVICHTETGARIIVRQGASAAALSHFSRLPKINS